MHCRRCGVRAGTTMQADAFLCRECWTRVAPGTASRYRQAIGRLTRLPRFATDEVREKVWAAAVAAYQDCKDEALGRGDLFAEAAE